MCNNNFELKKNIYIYNVTGKVYNMGVIYNYRALYKMPIVYRAI